MFAVQPLARPCSDEELRAVGVRARIGHAQQVGLCVADDPVSPLVVEFGAVDALAAHSRAVREVPWCRWTNG